MDLLFRTFEEASAWAREVPGRAFSPNSTGEGFVGKDKDLEAANFYAGLDSKTIGQQLNRVSRAFFTSMGYRKVGTADPKKILRYLLPLTVEQLLMLRAAVEMQSKSAEEATEADRDDGRQSRDMRLMLEVINERLKGTSLHNFATPNRRPAREPKSSGNLDNLYSSVASGDGQKAYLGDGVWVAPDGTLSDEGR